MLTINERTLEAAARPVHQSETSTTAAVSRQANDRLSRAIRFEWLGQMAASLCWIASVLNYGITCSGDWLQLAAACCWLMANMASIVLQKGD